MVGRVSFSFLFCSSRGCLALLLLLYPLLPRLSTIASPLSGSFAGPRELGARDVMGRKEGGLRERRDGPSGERQSRHEIKRSEKKNKLPKTRAHPSLSLSRSEKQPTNAEGEEDEARKLSRSLRCSCACVFFFASFLPISFSISIPFPSVRVVFSSPTHFSLSLFRPPCPKPDQADTSLPLSLFTPLPCPALPCPAPPLPRAVFLYVFPLGASPPLVLFG